MNCANLRRNLSDSWLTFTTNIRDRLSLLFARWSFSVYDDPDCDEWLNSIAHRAAGHPYKGRWYRLGGGDTIKVSEPHVRYDQLVKEHGLPGGPAVPENWERKA